MADLAPEFPAAGRVLGIDVGQRRIGVALSDDRRSVASPIEVVSRFRDPEAHRRRIDEIAREWEVVGLVVGLPLSLDGHEGAAAVAARAEMAALADTTRLPVIAYDERFTTVTADEVLREQGLDGRERRGVVDQVAAAVLLQAWLDGPGAVTPGPT